ncbi:MAG: hypothetical protein JWM88_42 [Verrucomicrobia bacterium]|nr:hypothetical protein [Verrucomicrobiota bacterium]
MESSDTRPIFQQAWVTPTYPEVLLRLRQVANGIESCGPYPGLRWITETDDLIHRARPQDLEDAACEISAIDGAEVGNYARELVGSYLSSQLLPLEDGEGLEGYWYSAVGVVVVEPGPASYPSIRLTPEAMAGVQQAFRTYFEGRGDIVCVVSPVTLPISYLKQSGPGVSRHILYTADILQNSEKGINEGHGPRVFARAIYGVPPHFPPSTDVRELERAGAAHDPCLPEHAHVLPFLVSLTRFDDPGAIKWASRLFRDSKDAAEAKGKLLLQIATQIYGINPEIFGQLEMDPDAYFLSGGAYEQVIRKK